MVEEAEEEGEKEKDEKEESKVTVNDKWTMFIVFLATCDISH